MRVQPDPTARLADGEDDARRSILRLQLEEGRRLQQRAELLRRRSERLLERRGLNLRCQLGRGFVVGLRPQVYFRSYFRTSVISVRENWQYAGA